MYKFLTKNSLFLPVLVLTLIILLTTLSRFHLSLANRSFSYLAYSFSKSRLSFFPDLVPFEDTAFFNGQHFLPLGPFPAVILTPIAYFASNNLGLIIHSEATFYFLLVILVLYLINKIARYYKFSFYESFYLAFAFCFASAFLGVIIHPIPNYYSHILVVVLQFLAIKEYLFKRRYLLIGIFIGLMLATRVTAGFSILFFIGSIFFLEKDKLFIKLTKLYRLIIPVFLVILLLMNYNHARFGNYFETGYNYTAVRESLQVALNYGFVSVKHIPSNLYHLLLAVPKPVLTEATGEVIKKPFVKLDPWGMSIFITSPYFIYLFFLKYKDKFSAIVFSTILVIVFLDSLIFSKGYFQFGYRFSLDFLPFLFLIFMRNYKIKHKALPNSFVYLILASALVNLFLFTNLKP